MYYSQLIRCTTRTSARLRWRRRCEQSTTTYTDPHNSVYTNNEFFYHTNCTLVSFPLNNGHAKRKQFFVHPFVQTRHSQHSILQAYSYGIPDSKNVSVSMRFECSRLTDIIYVVFFIVFVHIMKLFVRRTLAFNATKLLIRTRLGVRQRATSFMYQYSTKCLI